MQKKGFIRKIRLISKSMTSQPGKQTISIHILPNISRSKGNEIWSVKRIQHEKSYIKIFLKNHTQNVVEKLFPDPFLLYQN